MYRHVLVPVDCTDDALRAMPRIIKFVAQMTSCQVTIAASVTPAPTEQISQGKRLHAADALNRLHAYLRGFGVHTQCRIVQGADPATAFAAESLNSLEQYDLILMAAYQTRIEGFDFPCTGSLVDQIAAGTGLPILVLPSRH